MKVIDRYLMQEIVTPFLLALFVFVLILLTSVIIESVEYFINNNVSLILIFRILFASLPQILQFTIPMAVLTSILIAVGRLSGDSEITALRANGISLYRMGVPIFLFAFLCWAVCQYITIVGIPKAGKYREQILYDILESSINIGLKPHIFNDNFKDLVIYCDNLQPRTNEMHDIFLYRQPVPKKANYIFAQIGFKETYPDQKRVVLTLENGIIHEISEPSSENFSATQFRKKLLAIDLSTQQDEEIRSSDEDKSFSEIRSIIKEYAAGIERVENWLIEKRAKLPKNNPQLLQSSALQGKPKGKVIKLNQQRLTELQQEIRELENRIPTFTKVYNKFRALFHKKLAFPIACFVFVLVGIPLGIRAKTGGKSTGFSISVVLILFYYMLFIGGEGMALEGTLTPWLGIWSANILLTLLGIYLYVKVAREKPFRMMQFIATKISLLLQTLVAKIKMKQQAQHEKVNRQRAHFYFYHSFPRILDIYISRRFIRVFTLLCLIIISITVIFEFLAKIRSFISYKAEFHYYISYVFLKAPFFLVLSIHVAVLIATILTINILARNNELTAMKANGISLLRAALPILVIAFVIAAGVLLFNEKVVPKTNDIAEDILNYQIKKKTKPSLFTHNKNWYRGSQNSIYSFSSFDQREGQNVLNDFLIYNLNDHFMPIRKVTAQKVTWDSEQRSWFYLNAEETLFKQDGTPAQTTSFPSLQARLTEDVSEFKREIKESDKMNYTELKNYINSLGRKGIDTTVYKTDLHAKISMPLISWVIALFGIPFAITFQRSGTLVGVGFSIFIGMIYFVAYRMGISLGHGGQFPPFLAAWGANLLFIFIGLYLILRKDITPRSWLIPALCQLRQTLYQLSFIFGSCF